MQAREIEWRTAGSAVLVFALAAVANACGRSGLPEETSDAASPASYDAAAVAKYPERAPPTDEPELPGQVEGDYIVKDFHFASGETLPELRIHYTTVGTRHRDAHGHVDNAVLLLHGTMGRGKGFFADAFRQEMFGRGQPLDTTRFFVVLPDDIGHGRSSKPSDGLHARFPHYAYRDMVALQNRLVVDALGLRHLHLVAGTSMGGMHTWLWSEMYPDAMDAAIPIAATPTVIKGRNLLWRRIIIEATKNDPAYRSGEYFEPPHGYLATLPLFHVMLDSTAHLQQVASTMERATGFVRGGGGAGHPPVDANDAIYALDASRDYDPEPDLAKIVAPILAVDFADDEIVGPSMREANLVLAQVHSARLVVIDASAATRGHSTLGLAANWREPVAEFLRKVH